MLNLSNILNIAVAVLSVYRGVVCSAAVDLFVFREHSILPAVAITLHSLTFDPYYIRFGRAIYQEHVDFGIFILPTPLLSVR